MCCICDQKHFCISCLFSPHKFLAALNSVWNIKPVSSEHSIKCWRIQLLQVYKIVWWLCLQCMAKDNYSWQERGLGRWNLVRDVELKNKSPVSWSCFPPGWCSGRTSAPYSPWPRKKLASWATIASPLHVHETKYTSGGRRGSAESYRHTFNF